MAPFRTNVATLIAADRAESGLISEASDRLAAAGCQPAGTEWLETGKAADIMFDGKIAAARVALAPLEAVADIAVQAAEHRRKMLLVSDMDSTMITVECIDELADYAGIKPEIAAITERAMAGELDFVQALHERVALLAGLREDVISQCLAERVRPMAGAETLVKTMAAWGAHTVLVSGGFHSFADPVATMIGFANAHANTLELQKGRLTGRLLGQIVDAEVKSKILIDAAKNKNLPLAKSMAVGDGANDLAMILTATEANGSGIAYHAKPLLAAAAKINIRFGDLTGLLYLQGIRSNDWISLTD